MTQFTIKGSSISYMSVHPLFAKEFRVDNATTASQDWYQQPTLTVLNNGNIAFIWEMEQQAGSDAAFNLYGSVYDAEGNTVKDAFVVNPHTVLAEGIYAIAALTGGGYVITWPDADLNSPTLGIWGRLFDNNGNGLYSMFKVSTIQIWSPYGIGVAGLTNGHFAVTWQIYTDALIRVQLFDSSANKIGTENVFSQINGFWPNILALSNGGFAIAWENDGSDGSGYGGYFRLFDAGGDAFANNIQADT